MSAPVALSVLAAVLAGAAVLELARVPRTGSGLWARRRRRGGRQPRASGARWAAVTGDGPTELLLDGAGRTHVPDVEALRLRRRTGALLGGAWGGALALLLGGPPLALVVAPAGALAGWLLPVAALRRAGAARTERLRDQAPEVLELLAVALGCGLPIRAALEAGGRWAEGELAAGLQRAAGELAHGAAIDATTARLAREYPAAEVDAAVAILDRARHHGTPAAAPLRALATGARHARARRAVDHAARAAPKVQLVAALLLVPAAMCILAAALVAGAARG
jgi:tight adherence protein C